MISVEQFWRTTGAKFQGSDEELQALICNCKYQHAWCDEEGYFDKFLCLKDCKICDKKCHNHHPNLNEDIKDFVNILNERLKK